jgi:putative sterol carrier protein
MTTIVESESLNENSFTKKRNRKHSAQTLPLGLEHHMMKKYVVYYREWIDRTHTKEREYFKIEKHPDLPKSWTSSKSGKIKWNDKLAEANKIVDDLEKKRKENFQNKTSENSV